MLTDGSEMDTMSRPCPEWFFCQHNVAPAAVAVFAAAPHA